jgi:hypothetical protein
MNYSEILDWTLVILKGPILFLFITVLMLTGTTFAYSIYEQRKALSLLKDKNSFVGRINFKDWAKFIKTHRNYSIYPYLFFVGLVAASVYYTSYLVLTVSFAFLIWKQISLYWPCTFVFSREGIYFWDPFIMSIRENFPDKVLWDEVIEINYSNETNEVIIQTEFEILYYPVSEKHSQELLTWLKENYLSRVVSYEYEKSTALYS